MVDNRLLQHWAREQVARAQARAAWEPKPEMGHVLHAFLEVARRRTPLRVVTDPE
jgi:phosphate-selective porin